MHNVPSPPLSNRTLYGSLITVVATYLCAPSATCSIHTTEVSAILLSFPFLQEVEAKLGLDVHTHTHTHTPLKENTAAFLARRRYRVEVLESFMRKTGHIKNTNTL